MDSLTELKDDYDHINELVLYTITNIPGKGCDTNLFDSQIASYCSCTDGCVNVNNCLCLSSTGGSLNYRDRQLVDKKMVPSSRYGGECVIECGIRCRCDAKSCANRLVQFGPATGLKIENFGPKGYGVTTTSTLHKGQFLCEYAGEVIGEEEAAKRRAGDIMSCSSNYIFTLNEFVDDKLQSKTIVDATCIANIGRYINHSCDPNSVVIPVRVDSVVPKLCIFAQQDIPAGDEITYKYGNPTECKEAQRNLDMLKLCLCGSSKCAKYLPTT